MSGRNASANVFCALRQRLVRRTPEEEVRQELIAWLFRERGYQRDDMQAEFTIMAGSRGIRADLVIWHRTDFIGHRYATENIYAVVECKKRGIPEVTYKRAAEQLLSYANMTAAWWAVLCVGLERSTAFELRDVQRGRIVRRVPLERSLAEFPRAADPAPSRRTLMLANTAAAGAPPAGEPWGARSSPERPGVPATASPADPGAPVPQETEAPQAMRWVGGPALTLEQHAALTAELTMWPGYEREVLARFAVTAQQRVQADHFYAVRMANDPQAGEAWARAKQSHAAWLATKRRGS